MSGRVADSGKQIGIDMTIVRGKGATGSLSLDGATVDLIVIGRNAYMRASPTFWKKFTHSSMAASLFAGKWLKFPANDAQFGSLTSLTNDKGIFNKLTSSHGKLVNEGETTFNGQSVVAIKDATKSGTLYVLASGTPYPAGLSKAKGLNGGSITFDQWDQAVTLTAPKGALDLSKLTG
jgi:hypothetical protein